MDRLWPSIGSKFACNDGFWAHEWKPNGVCQPKTPKRYFQDVIELRRRIDLDSAIKAEVTPGQSAPRDHFISATESKVGDVAPVLQCIDKKGNKFLSEIVICIAKSGNRMMRCTPADLRKDSCGPIIHFPDKPEK